MSRPLIPDATLDRFLALVRAGASTSEACRVVHIGRTTAYDYRRRDPGFAARWAGAEAEAMDAIEDRVFARAMDSTHPDSSRLLMFLLVRRRPEQFGCSLEVDVSVDGARTPDELRAVLAAALPGRATAAGGGERS